MPELDRSNAFVCLGPPGDVTWHSDSGWKQLTDGTGSAAISIGPQYLIRTAHYNDVRNLLVDCMQLNLPSRLEIVSGIRDGPSVQAQNDNGDGDGAQGGGETTLGKWSLIPSSTSVEPELIWDPNHCSDGTWVPLAQLSEVDSRMQRNDARAEVLLAARVVARAAAEGVRVRERKGKEHARLAATEARALEGKAKEAAVKAKAAEKKAKASEEKKPQARRAGGNDWKQLEEARDLEVVLAASMRASQAAEEGRAKEARATEAVETYRKLRARLKSLNAVILIRVPAHHVVWRGLRLHWKAGPINLVDISDGEQIWRRDNGPETVQDLDLAKLFDCRMPPRIFQMGTRLVTAVEAPSKMVMEATVVQHLHGSRHTVHFGPAAEEKEMDLNSFNCAMLRFPSLQAFRTACQQHCEKLARDCEYIEDSITGRVLRTRDQSINVQVLATSQGNPAHIRITKVLDLLPLLLEHATQRAAGICEGQSLLLRADPGTGKSWSSIQLACEIADKLGTEAVAEQKEVPFVPLLVYVQRLARHLRATPRTPPEEYLQLYIRLEYPSSQAVLMQACEMGALVVIIDGIDEASGLRTQMEEWVLGPLRKCVQRIFVTSRPEGIAKERWLPHFVVFDLRRLSVAQQKQAVTNQVGQSPIFEHLATFGSMQAAHDDIFCAIDLQHRHALESFSSEDLLFPRGSQQRDSAMRQTASNGRWICVSTSAIVPCSALLQNHNTIITASVLHALDEQLVGVGVDAAQQDVQPLVEGLREQIIPNAKLLAMPHPDQLLALESSLSLLIQLAMLVLKRRKTVGLARQQLVEGTSRTVQQWYAMLLRTVPQTTATTLWPVVLARTDQLYLAVEACERPFQRALEMLAAQVGSSTGESVKLRLFPLKDPVQAHDSAFEVYANQFSDFHDAVVTPEACLLDMLSAHVICQGAASVLHLQELMRRGFFVNVPTIGTVKLELLHCENKFATLDAIHFRHFKNNLRLVVSGMTTDNRGLPLAPPPPVFVDVHVYLEPILERYNQDLTREHFDFFSAMLPASTHPGQLDQMLEKVVLFLLDCQANPVLNAMLVTIFSDQPLDQVHLPSDRYGVYLMAFHAVLKRIYPTTWRRVAKALRRVSLVNYLADGRREFTSNQALEALKPLKLEAVWRKLEDETTGIPWIRTLTAADPFNHKGGLYEFRHLSFQEALCGQALVIETDNHLEATSLFSVKFLKRWPNICQIGGSHLASAFAEQTKTWNFSRKLDEKAAVESLTHLFQGPALRHLRRLNLASCPAIDPASFSTLVKSGGLESSDLHALDCRGCVVGPTGTASLAYACMQGAFPALVELFLDSCHVSDDGMAALAAQLKCAFRMLETLSLGDNGITDEGMHRLGDGLADGGLPALQTLDLRNNVIGDVGMCSISYAMAHGALTYLKRLNLAGNRCGDTNLLEVDNGCGVRALNRALAARAANVRSKSKLPPVKLKLPLPQETQLALPPQALLRPAGGLRIQDCELSRSLGKLILQGSGSKSGKSVDHADERHSFERVKLTDRDTIAWA